VASAAHISEWPLECGYLVKRQDLITEAKALEKNRIFVILDVAPGLRPATSSRLS